MSRLRCPTRPEPIPWENTPNIPQLSIQGVIPGYILQYVNQVNCNGHWLNVFTEIQDMNIGQTAYWIWTIGYSEKWEEAEFYARTFGEHCIDGSCLEYLNHERLKKELHVMNKSHRVVILTSISYLKDNAIIGTRSFDEYSFSLNSVQSSINTSNWNSANEYSSIWTATDSGRTREKGNFLSETNSTSSSYPQVMARKAYMLILTPKKDVGKGCKLRLADIKRNFRNNYYRVKVEPSDSHSNLFIVTFSDKESLEKALRDADNLGYHLEKKLRKRPKPTKPLKYKVLTRCLIRKGKSLKSKGIRYLKKDDIVLANQFKNCRARLVDMKGDGSYEILGWVTVHTTDGIQQLQQLDYAE